MSTRFLQTYTCRWGFTLIEVLITLGFVGILTVLSLRLVKPSVPVEAWSRRCADFLEHVQATYRIHEARTGLPPVRDPLLCNVGYVSPLERYNPVAPCAETRSTHTGLHGLNAYLMNNEEKASYGTVTVSGVATPYLDYPMGVRLWLRPELLHANFKNRLDATPFDLSRDTFNNYHEFMLIDFDKKTQPTSLNDTDIVPIRYVEDTGELQTWYQFWVVSESPGTAVPRSFYDTFRGL
ncbi:MAG: type II secretion system protein [Vampirovibrionales bacterium]